MLNLSCNQKGLSYILFQIMSSKLMDPWKAWELSYCKRVGLSYMSRTHTLVETGYCNIERDSYSVKYLDSRGCTTTSFAAELRHKLTTNPDPNQEEVNSSGHPLTSMPIAQTTKVWYGTAISEWKTQCHCRFPQLNQFMRTRISRQRLFYYHSSSSHNIRNPCHKIMGKEKKNENAVFQGMPDATEAFQKASNHCGTTGMSYQLKMDWSSKPTN